MKIEKEDLDELVKLYKAAMSTPMLYYRTGDTATDAWQAVKNKMDALGNKYGFEPEISAIDGLTGVVTTFKKREKDEGGKP